MKINKLSIVYIICSFINVGVLAETPSEEITRHYNNVIGILDEMPENEAVDEAKNRLSAMKERYNSSSKNSAVEDLNKHKVDISEVVKKKNELEQEASKLKVRTVDLTEKPSEELIKEVKNKYHLD